MSVFFAKAFAARPWNSMVHILAWCAVVIGSATMARGQQPPAASAAGMIEVKSPIVALINDVKVPAQVEGVLASLLVEEGSIVEAGQVLAVMDDREAKVTLALKLAEELEAKLNRENDINKRYAENSEQISSEKAVAYKELLKRGSIPKWEAKTADLEAFRDKLQIELADLNQEIADAKYNAKQSERQLAEVAVEKRSIKAPFSGFVENRMAQLGEWVQAGAPILKLIQMDRLRVQGFVEDKTNSSRVAAGMKVVVRFVLEGNEVAEVAGTIGFVGNELDLSSGRRVWMEFENERIGNDWKIRPGMKPLSMVIDPR